MRRLLPAFGLLAVVAGCAQTEKAATTVQSAAQAQVTPTLSTTDATFLNTASTSGITEVTFGQLARQQGGRAAVRDFGMRMVDEHTTGNQEILALATAKQLAPSSSVDGTHQALYDQLKTMHGRAFDRTYLNDQATDHAALVQAIQTELASGTDPDVKALASKMLPMVSSHLKLAERLGGKPAMS